MVLQQQDKGPVRIKGLGDIHGQRAGIGYIIAFAKQIEQFHNKPPI